MTKDSLRSGGPLERTICIAGIFTGTACVVAVTVLVGLAGVSFWQWTS